MASNQIQPPTDRVAARKRFSFRKASAHGGLAFMGRSSCQVLAEPDVQYVALGFEKSPFFLPLDVSEETSAEKMWRSFPISGSPMHGGIKSHDLDVDVKFGGKHHFTSVRG